MYTTTGGGDEFKLGCGESEMPVGHLNCELLLVNIRVWEAPSSDFQSSGRGARHACPVSVTTQI